MFERRWVRKFSLKLLIIGAIGLIIAGLATILHWRCIAGSSLVAAGLALLFAPQE